MTTSSVARPNSPIGLGIVGLGMAGTMMVRAAATHPSVALRACADTQAAPREAFARKFGAKAYGDIEALCADPAIEAVYIATPHQFHAEHAEIAASRGKHIILEKPMALTLEDCDAIIAAVERHGTHLIVGHTHAFDPNIRAMRRLIASGEMGRLGMIATWNYTSFLYRPRRPEELDTEKGGGIVFNQLPHQIDIARLLGGGMVRSVRAMMGALDPARPTEGASTVLLDFEHGAAASLVYSGYDFFDSDELHYGVTEAGTDKPPGQHGASRRALTNRQSPEEELRARRAYTASQDNPDQPHLPHFGIIVATCEKGDIKTSADGLLVYDESGVREIPVARGQGWAGHGDVLDELWGALREEALPLHDGRWGKATLEVALACLQSSRERREVMLHHQVPVPPDA